MTLSFDLPRGERALLEIHDLAGRRVRVLRDASLPEGRHQCRWDGRDGAGRLLPSGVYLARLRAGGREESRRLILIK